MPEMTSVRIKIGRVLGFVLGALLIADGAMKLAKPAFVVEATVQLGYRESVIVGLGVLLVVCSALYLVPRTSVLGAILLTGYLGGAVATHVRIGDNLFSIVLPAILGALLWGALALHDQRVAALIASEPNR